MSFTLSFSHFPLVNRSCFSSPVVARGVFHPGPKVMLLTAGLTPFTSTSNWKTTQGAPHHINSLRYNVIHITLLKIKKQKRSYQPIHLSYTGEDHASTTHTFIRNETYLSLSLSRVCVCRVRSRWSAGPFMWHLHLETRSFSRLQRPPPLRLPLWTLSLSTRTVWKPLMVVFSSGTSWCSHVSVKHIKLHSRYSFWLWTSAVSSSILFPSDLTFPMTMEGRLAFSSVVFCVLCIPCVSVSRFQPEYHCPWSPKVACSLQLHAGKDRVSKCRSHVKGPADHLDLTRRTHTHTHTHTQTREREISFICVCRGGVVFPCVAGKVQR